MNAGGDVKADGASYLDAERQERTAAYLVARGPLAVEPLRWLLDSFLYQADVGQLAPKTQRALWDTLAVLVGDATGGRWTVRADPEEVRKVAILDDTADWRGLPPSFRIILEHWRANPPRPRPKGFNPTVSLVRPRVEGEVLSEAQAVVRRALEDILLPPHELFGPHRCGLDLEGVRVVGGLEVDPFKYSAPGAEGWAKAREGWPRIATPRGPEFQAPLVPALLVAALELVGQTPPGRLRRCPYPVAPPREECGRVFLGRKRQKWCPAHQEAARQARNRKAQQKRRERIEAERQRQRRRSRRRKGGRA